MKSVSPFASLRVEVAIVAAAFEDETNSEFGRALLMKMNGR